MNDLTMKPSVNEMKEENKIIKEYVKSDENVPNKHINLKQRMVSSIVQELQKELERPIAEVIYH
jgi:DNA-directed RNA polymerase specialized sigma subunit